jgi:glucuronate isomerase
MNRRLFVGAALSAAAAVPQRKPATSTSLVGRILQGLEALDTIDTHEHIIPESERVAAQVDFFTLASHYLLDDVTSAGLPRASRVLIEKAETPEAEKWRLFEPYWKYARFTGYGEALQIAMRDIYAIADISASTLPKMNRAIAERNRMGLYKFVLKDRARIRYCMNDDYWNAVPVRPDPTYFRYAHKFDRFAAPITPAGLQRLEKASGVSITSLPGLKKAMETSFEQALAVGMIAVKSTMAYERNLRFEEVSEADAARTFDSLISGRVKAPPEGFERQQNRPFRQMEDHMYHYLIGLVREHKLPMQIHTGLHAGNGNFIQNSNPADLTNIFFLYPEVHFDLFHIGYPYQGEISVLGKLFPNVNVDFCWMHIVSPYAARQALHTMLDMVPANKIFGFGGDYRYPELSYAHLVMARRNIAQVLAERVEARNVTETEATELGRWMLVDNPARLYGS